MSVHTDVLIIGGGVTGLSAGRKLQHRGKSVLVIEAEETLGGRVATESLHGGTGELLGRWDSGAQFATFSSNMVTRELAYWDAYDLMKPWHTGPGGLTRLRPLKGMRAFAEAIAKGLDVRLGDPVDTIQRGEHSVCVRTKSGEEFCAGKLLVTLPVPQAMRLFTRSRLYFSTHIEELLAAVRYERCFALLAELEGPSSVELIGFVDLDGEVGILQHIVDNRFKNISGSAYTLTALSTYEYATTHWERPRAEVQEELLAALQQQVAAPVLDSHLVSWEYADAVHRIEADYLEASQGHIWLAGDSFAASDHDAERSRPCRIEAAILSGLSAAMAMVAD